MNKVLLAFLSLLVFVGSIFTSSCTKTIYVTPPENQPQSSYQIPDSDAVINTVTNFIKALTAAYKDTTYGYEWDYWEGGNNSLGIWEFGHSGAPTTNEITDSINYGALEALGTCYKETKKFDYNFPMVQGNLAYFDISIPDPVISASFKNAFRFNLSKSNGVWKLTNIRLTYTDSFLLKRYVTN